MYQSNQAKKQSYLLGFLREPGDLTLAASSPAPSPSQPSPPRARRCPAAGVRVFVHDQLPPSPTTSGLDPVEP